MLLAAADDCRRDALRPGGPGGGARPPRGPSGQRKRLADRRRRAGSGRASRTSSPRLPDRDQHEPRPQLRHAELARLYQLPPGLVAKLPQPSEYLRPVAVEPAAARPRTFSSMTARGLSPRSAAAPAGTGRARRLARAACRRSRRAGTARRRRAGRPRRTRDRPGSRRRPRRSSRRRRGSCAGSRRRRHPARRWPLLEARLLKAERLAAARADLHTAQLSHDAGSLCPATAPAGTARQPGGEVRMPVPPGAASAWSGTAQRSRR